MKYKKIIKLMKYKKIIKLMKYKNGKKYLIDLLELFFNEFYFPIFKDFLDTCIFPKHGVFQNSVFLETVFLKIVTIGLFSKLQ